MKKIRYGIIGVGNQGNYYLGLFERGDIENGIVTAVCDVIPDRLEKIAQKYGDKYKLFSEYKEMLDSGLCDAVLVETPHYQHPEIVIECLKREINVICDKPAGVYTKQVYEMNEVAKNSKAKFSMMFNQRTNCLYRKMKEMIERGEIGELQRVVWVITDWYRTETYYKSGGWRATWAGEGGGVLINQCPHQIDLVQWVTGKMPKTVNAFCHYGKWHDIEVEDDVTAYFEYDNGATGVFITTTGETPGTNRLEISGTKGRLVCNCADLVYYKLEADNKEYCKTSQSGFDAPKCEKIIVETDGKNPQHAGIINNFTNALLGLEEMFVDGTDGTNCVELINAMELSGWNNGERISIPVDQERYLRELNAHRLTSRIKTDVKERVEDTSNSYGGKKERQ